MNIIIWKKLTELKKHPLKIVLLLIIPLAILVIYPFLLNISPELYMVIFPLIVSFFVLCSISTIDEAMCASMYETLGIRMRHVWIVRLCMIMVISIIISEIYLIVASFILSWTWDSSLILMNISSIFIATALISIGSVSFLGYTKIQELIASIFGIIHMAIIMIFIVVPLLMVINLPSPTLFYMLGSVSIIWIISSTIVSKYINVKENNIRNTEAGLSVYDKALYRDDEF